MIISGILGNFSYGTSPAALIHIGHIIMGILAIYYSKKSASGYEYNYTKLNASIFLFLPCRGYISIPIVVLISKKFNSTSHR